MSVLNKPISYFPSVKATNQSVQVDLLNILVSEKHKDIITALRNESDEKKQSEMKSNLSCFTVGGLFSRRCEEGLIQHSGLCAVDLDSAEDYDIQNLLQELKKIPFIAYTGLSCRGKRLYSIIPFEDASKYAKHYECLIKSFEDIGLPMGDTCHKQISQPRYVSYNESESCFFNHDAKSYNLLPVEKKYYFPKNKNANTQRPDKPFNWCVEQKNKSISFIKDQRHEYIIQLARYCNIKGLSESETLSGCLQFSMEDFDAKEITSKVKGIYKKHISSFNKIPFLSQTN